MTIEINAAGIIIQIYIKHIQLSHPRVNLRLQCGQYLRHSLGADLIPNPIRFFVIAMNAIINCSLRFYKYRSIFRS